MEDELPWLTYNHGEVPPEVVEERFPEEGYPMMLTQEDAELMIHVVNQGIDSHLEAVTGFTYKWVDSMFSRKLGIEFKEADGFNVLLRRLGELEGFGERAINLRGSVYQTLNIEEV